MSHGNLQLTLTSIDSQEGTMKEDIMRLYIVGIFNLEKFADALRERDISYQIITDALMTGEIACNMKRSGAVLCFLPPSYAYQVDCDCLLRVWNKQNRFTLVQFGDILNLDGAHALLAVPQALCSDVSCVELLNSLLMGEVSWVVHCVSLFPQDLWVRVCRNSC